jgi:exopolyphosphatase/guanosine-5'-triphosphate,3'-diphosphate pyrophosphatase
MARKRFRLAAIDIGTNSIHMIIVEVLRRGFRVIDKEKEMVQLGRGSLQGNPLTEAAMERGVTALKHMADIARQWEVDEIVAVATSAVREAPNRREFVRRAEEIAGVEVRVISGDEEADYIYRAVRASVDFHGATALAIDIGGGSVELIVGTDSQVFFTRSEPLGVLRLTQQFLDKDPPGDRAIYECRKFVRDRLKKPIARIRTLGFDFCIGTSGTIVTLAEIAAPPTTEEMTSGLRLLRRARLEELIVDLASKTTTQRVTTYNLDPKRAETLLAGAIVVDEILDAVGAKSLQACTAALREGIVERALEERQIVESGPRGSVRREAVLELAERSDVDLTHAGHVAKLALRIFDQTVALHKMKNSDRELLEHAAMLHEVGVGVSFDQYHKHTFYLVRHAALRGFTEEQVAVIANVARYHRKATPDLEHQNFRELKPSQRTVVEKLTAILRLADALDRGRRQSVRDVGVEVDEFAVTFTIRPRSDPSVEVESAVKRGKYFAKLFDRQVEFLLQE